jgi:hypothetical protein
MKSDLLTFAMILVAFSGILSHFKAFLKHFKIRKSAKTTILASKMTHKSAKNRFPKNGIMTFVRKLEALRGIFRHFYALLMLFRIRKWSQWAIFDL